MSENVPSWKLDYEFIIYDSCKTNDTTTTLEQRVVVFAAVLVSEHWLVVVYRNTETLRKYG